MLRRNLFNDFIKNLDPVWKELRKHPRKDTKGYDDLSIADFISNEKSLLKNLKSRLRNGSFRFSPLKPVRIDDGKREILIATVNDRIVGKAILKTIIPIFAKNVTESNYCPVSKTPTTRATQGLIGVPRAAKDMQTAFAAGYTNIFETDIIGFFDHIKKKDLLKIIKKQVASKRILELIKGILHFEVWNCDAEEYDDVIGIAQGSALSPLFAAIYLYDFDKSIEALGDVKMIRYVDDLVILCKTPDRAKQMFPLVEKTLKKIGLDIHPIDKKDAKGRIKTAIRNIKKESLTFLGLKFINPKDITISDKKVAEKLEDIKCILGNSRPLLVKLTKIRNQLDGFIHQYRQPHYDTKGRLNALISDVQRQIAGYYKQTYNSILGYPPFRKGITPIQENRFYKFLGIDLADLLIK